MKIAYTCLLVCYLYILLLPQSKAQTVAFEDLGRLQLQEERPVLVFIHTGWCRYCNSMRNSLHNHKEVAELVKRKFYLVELNAEAKNTIRFAGRDFQFKPTGLSTGTHELAAELGTVNGQISYPSLCILNNKNEITFQYAGFLDPVSLLKLLRSVSK